jgi:hypothetical protein
MVLMQFPYGYCVGTSKMGPSGTESYRVFISHSAEDMWLAVHSGWMGYEVGSASALGKDIVVLKPQSLSVRDLSAEIGTLPMIDFDQTTPETAAKKIVAVLEADRHEAEDRLYA